MSFGPASSFTLELPVRGVDVGLPVELQSDSQRGASLQLGKLLQNGWVELGGGGRAGDEKKGRREADRPIELYRPHGSGLPEKSLHGAPPESGSPQKGSGGPNRGPPESGT
jgi:hypothetical protein